MDLASAPPAEGVSSRPQGPRTGRRAANNLVPAASDAEVAVDNVNPAAPAGPRPQVPRRRAGWGDAAAEGLLRFGSQATEQAPSIDTTAADSDNLQLSGISRRKAAHVSATQEERQPDSAEPSQQIEEVDTFMDIPDLEVEEDLSRQVAAAPAARRVSVMDIAELESEDLFRLPVVGKDHEVDLSLLTACLCPAVEVAEELVPWDFEMLLTEVASAFNSEKELCANKDDQR
ncbi:hypothetical protein WJX77_007328 [Trebouxia sp. C0004]